MKSPKSNQNIPYFFNERNRIRIACMQKELYNRKTHELVSQAISKVLTTGKVKRIEMEEAFLLPEVTQQIYDVMTINLNIDPVYITDRISWHLGAPFPDSINLIVKEYKMARNLNPIRIIIIFLDRNQLIRWFNLYYYNSSFYTSISKIWNFQLFSSFGRKKIWGKQSRK